MGNIKFRTQFLILVAMLVAVSVGFALFMLRTNTRITTGQVDRRKTMVDDAMDYLDAGIPQSFDAMLRDAGAAGLSNADKAKLLNQQLAPVFASAEKLYPGLEMGVYDSDLNVLVNGNTVYGSGALSAYRKGEISSTTGTGDILDFIVNRPAGTYVDGYRPLVRGGRTIGAIWVRESVNSIYQREQGIQMGTLLLVVVCLLIGGAGSLVLFGNFVRSVSAVKDGVKTLAGNLGYRLPLAPGEVGEIAASINDLAARLTQSRSYNGIILASVVEGVLAVDSQGQVIGCNDRARDLLGLPEETATMHLADLPAEQEGVNLLRQALTGGQLVHDLEVRKGSRVVLFTTGLLAGDNGEVQGALVTVRDVSRRVRLQESSRRQERLAALGKLVAGVAHEIRNPLTSISGYIQYWQINPNPSPRALDNIRREVMRLNTIVQKLLYFAHPAQAVYAVHDINTVVPRTAHFFRSTHPKVMIREDLAPGLPEALIDPMQIEQVLMNLVYNAVQATGDGGTVSLATSLDQEGRMVVLTVSDTGCGIEAEHLPYLFDPFFTTRKNGSGLGLAICHEIIQGHGGRIEVTSTPGQGSTFQVYVPVAGGEEDGTCTGGGR